MLGEESEEEPINPFPTVEIDPKLLERSTSLSYVVKSISTWGWVLIATVNLACLGVTAAACRSRCRKAACCR